MEKMLPWVRQFAQKWLPGDLADCVRWLSTDNENKMLSLCRTLSSPGGLFPGALHLGCMAHAMQLVGHTVVNHSATACVRDLAAAVKSALKGKIHVSRRRRLRKLLARVDDRATTLPTHWGDTRWSAWFDQLEWIAGHWKLLTEFLKTEKTNLEAAQPKKKADKEGEQGDFVVAAKNRCLTTALAILEDSNSLARVLCLWAVACCRR